jgi:hypothetical protein
MSKHESADRQYFALDVEGVLTALGDCGDYEAADEIASDLGINALWLINADIAKQWVETINKQIEENER